MVFLSIVDKIVDLIVELHEISLFLSIDNA